VERDGLTVTATGPLAAQAFVQAIVDSLGGTTRSSTPPAK
jgi:hypothetical protein